MRTRWLAVATGLAAACAQPINLPPEPSSTSSLPHVERILPDVAIAALGSPVLIEGANLGAVTQVEIGPMKFDATRLEHAQRRKNGLTIDELLLHVDRAALEQGRIKDADGETYPVRVTSDAGAEVALDTLRIYANIPSIDEVAPQDLAGEALFYVRGNGFDDADYGRNDLAFSDTPAANCWDPAKPLACVHAKVFWAARGVILARVPGKAPLGVVHVHYRNWVFENLAKAAQDWADNGRPLSRFFTGAVPEAGITDTSNPSTENVCAWATTTLVSPSIADTTVVWDAPGEVAATVRGGALELRGEGRLCYPMLSGGRNPRLRVFVDGAELAGSDVRCMVSGLNDLRAELPASVMGRPGTLHSVQVINPLFQSPLAFFTP